MITALELKNKLERFDKNTPLIDYNVWFGFLPAIILFPLFVILNNAHTESFILNSPFLLGFGFAGIFISSLVLVTGGLLITHFSLSRYIAIKSGIRRFNANSLLEDDSLAHGISSKIWEFLKIHRKHDPLYQADLEKKADKVKVETKFKKINEDYDTLYRFVGRMNRQNFENVIKTENEKDIELKKLRVDLSTAISSIATSKEKITELENKIKDLEGKK